MVKNGPLSEDQEKYLTNLPKLYCGFKICITLQTCSISNPLQLISFCEHTLVKHPDQLYLDLVPNG